MHCLHLGVSQWAVGNALVLLSGEGRWGVFEGQRKRTQVGQVLARCV